MGGKGGLFPASTNPTFMIESGTNPASTITMNQAAVMTKIQRSIACARGVPERRSVARSVLKNLAARVAIECPSDMSIADRLTPPVNTRELITEQ